MKDTFEPRTNNRPYVFFDFSSIFDQISSARESAIHRSKKAFSSDGKLSDRKTDSIFDFNEGLDNG